MEPKKKLHPLTSICLILTILYFVGLGVVNAALAFEAPALQLPMAYKFFIYLIIAVYFYSTSEAVKFLIGKDTDYPLFFLLPIGVSILLTVFQLIKFGMPLDDLFRAASLHVALPLALWGLIHWSLKLNVNEGKKSNPEAD